MIKLYDKTGEVLIGELEDCISCNVTEVRNGIFDARLVYPAMRLISNNLIKENIIVCKASDILLNQKFRIFNVKKKHSNTIEVIARHISFDLLYDFIENINIVNQSCEYALNTIFRNSQFSRHYKGHSDIINAQDYNMSMANCLNAIAGKEGSIIDTYGTGAEILRDNENIHVLNRRGHDNSVTIEYGKNLEGFECTEDTTDLITRIYPFAKKSTPDGETTITLNEKFVDSPRINLYSHPYIREVDLTSKFKDEDEINQAKLKLEAEKYFIETKCDIPKLTFNLKPVPLSKCVGFENLGEKLSLCDIATINHNIYGITTQAKVIKTVFNVLTDRYENIQLGDPKASLGDLIGGNSGNAPQVGPPGPPGPPGQDGNIGDFPDSLPAIPQLTANVLGFASVDLSWTYENKVYYNYQVFASKTENFEPNMFDLIFEGQASSFLHQVKPDETWYYRARAVNTHGKATELSTQVKVTTKKVDDFENYFSSVAIENLVAGIFSVDYMTAGIIKGHWIDAKQLSVTDGNGKRTLDIDSYGNVYLDVKSFKISNKQVYTTEEADTAINEAVKEVKTNILPNGSFNNGNNGWNKVNIAISSSVFYKERYWCNFYTSTAEDIRYATNEFDILPNRVYNFSMLLAQYSSSKNFYRIRIETKNRGSSSWFTVKEFTGRTAGTRDKYEQLSYSFKSDSNVEKCRVWIGKLSGETFDIYVADLFMGTGTIYARKSEFQILDDKISSKVSENEFGTLVEQNAHAVKIAWNNISNYVQFENGGLSIYNGSVTTSQKRSVFDENGNHFWRDGYYLGKIGTNKYSGDSSIKGLNFNLNFEGGYMTWAIKKISTDSDYTMKWTYANKTVGNYSSGKLHAGADIDMHNYYLRNVQFEGGGITGTLVFTQIVGMNTNGTASRWYNNSKLVFQNGILIDATWGNG